MNKVLATRSQRVKSAFHGSYPQRTIGCRIHGIDSIRRDTARGGGVVTVEFQIQLTWSQLDNTTCLRTYPYLSVFGKETIHEVTAQRINRRRTIPMLNLASLVIDDVHATERTHQEFIIRSDSKTRHHFVLERMVVSRAMILLLGAIEETTVGGDPDFTMIRDDCTGIASIERWEHRGDIPGNQLIVLYRELAHHAIVAQHHRSPAIYITKSQVGRIDRIVNGQDAVHLALFIKAETGKEIDGNHPDIAFGIAIHSGAKILQCLLELRLHLLVLTRRNDRLHRIEVEHLRTFLEGYPEATAIGTQSEIHEVETIVTHQTTTMCTDPHKAVRILKDIIGKIIRHSCCHVEVAYIKATRQTTLCKTAQSYEKCYYDGKNVSNHLSI